MLSGAVQSRRQFVRSGHTPRPNSSPPLGEFNRPSSTSSLSNLHVLVHVTSAVCQSRKGDRPLTTDQFCSFAVLQFCSGAAHPPALLLTPHSFLLAPRSSLVLSSRIDYSRTACHQLPPTDCHRPHPVVFPAGLAPLALSSHKRADRFIAPCPHHSRLLYTSHIQPAVLCSPVPRQCSAVLLDMASAALPRTAAFPTPRSQMATSSTRFALTPARSKTRWTTSANPSSRE